MAWDRVKDTGITRTVTVNISVFDTEQILQHLIDGEFITDHEAEMILGREDLDVGYEPLQDSNQDIATAWEYAARGNRNEALIWIERALGVDWVGRLTDV